MGQEHWKVGPLLADMMTLQVPPFWHFRPPVLQGFLYWQYSPTYSVGQLEF